MAPLASLFASRSSRQYVLLGVCGLFSFASGLLRSKKIEPFASLFMVASVVCGLVAFFWGVWSSRDTLEGKALPRLLAELISRGEVSLQEKEPNLDEDIKLLAELRLKALAADKTEVGLLQSQMSAVIVGLDTFLRLYPTSRPIAKHVFATYRLLLSRMKGAPKRVNLPRGAVHRLGEILARESGPSAVSADVDWELLEDGIITIGALFDVMQPTTDSEASKGSKSDDAKRKKDDDAVDAGDHEADDDALGTLTRLSFFTAGDVRSCMEGLVRAWNRYEDARMLSKVHYCVWSALACASAGLYAARVAPTLEEMKGETGVAAASQSHGFTADQVAALAALVTRTLRSYLQARQAIPKNTSTTPIAARTSGGDLRGNDKLPELCLYLSAILLRADEISFSKTAIAVGMGSVLRATLDSLADDAAASAMGDGGVVNSSSQPSQNTELYRVGTQVLIRLNNIIAAANADEN